MTSAAAESPNANLSLIVVLLRFLCC